MKKTAIAITISLLQASTSFAEDYVINYACKATHGEERKTQGRAYLLHVDEGKKVVKFQGKRYTIIKSTGNGTYPVDVDDDNGCVKYCWLAKGNGVSLDISTLVAGYAGFNFDGKNWDCDNRHVPPALLRGR